MAFKKTTKTKTTKTANRVGRRKSPKTRTAKR